MRLIDADLLKESISKRLKSFNPDGTEIEVADALALVNTMMEIDEQPTAFDLDKVVEQLDKVSDYYDFDEQGKEHVQMINLTEAIEIVRGGGVE